MTIPREPGTNTGTIEIWSSQTVAFSVFSELSQAKRTPDAGALGLCHCVQGQTMCSHRA